MSQLTLSKEEKIKILTAIEKSFNEAIAQKKIKTWFSTMRDITGLDWLSSPGINEKFHQYYLRFIPRQFLSLTNTNNIFSFVDTDVKVYALLTKMNIKVDEPEAKKVEETKKEITSINKDIEAAVDKYLTENGINLEVKDTLAKITNEYKTLGLKLEADYFVTLTAEIQRQIEKLRPVEVRINDLKVVKIDGKMHHAFERTLKFCNRYKQCFIAGPAGTGKTTLAGQVAKALELDFGFISCNLGLSSAQLLGRMDALGNYISADFVRLYEEGGVFLFDEVDAADANTMLIINSALANGLLSIPNRKEKNHAVRHKDFYCICAANTWGYGSSEYAGRNVLDAAFLDRFSASRLMVGYDTELESMLSSSHPEVAKIIWKVRKNVVDTKVKRVVSTRAIISGCIALTDGDTMKQFVDDFTCGWTEEEKKKALNGVAI